MLGDRKLMEARAQEIRMEMRCFLAHVPTRIVGDGSGIMRRTAGARRTANL